MSSNEEDLQELEQSILSLCEEDETTKFHISPSKLAGIQLPLAEDKARDQLHNCSVNLSRLSPIKRDCLITPNQSVFSPGTPATLKYNWKKSSTKGFCSTPYTSKPSYPKRLPLNRKSVTESMCITEENEENETFEELLESVLVLCKNKNPGQTVLNNVSQIDVSKILKKVDITKNESLDVTVKPDYDMVNDERYFKTLNETNSSYQGRFTSYSRSVVGDSEEEDTAHDASTDILGLDRYIVLDQISEEEDEDTIVEKLDDVFTGTFYEGSTIPAATINSTPTINSTTFNSTPSINSTTINSTPTITCNSTTIKSTTINSTPTINSTTINSTTINSTTINSTPKEGIPISTNKHTDETIDSSDLQRICCDGTITSSIYVNLDGDADTINQEELTQPCDKSLTLAVDTSSPIHVSQKEAEAVLDSTKIEPSKTDKRLDTDTQLETDNTLKTDAKFETDMKPELHANSPLNLKRKAVQLTQDSSDGKQEPKSKERKTEKESAESKFVPLSNVGTVKPLVHDVRIASPSPVKCPPPEDDDDDDDDSLVEVIMVDESIEVIDISDSTIVDTSTTSITTTDDDKTKKDETNLIRNLKANWGKDNTQGLKNSNTNLTSCSYKKRRFQTDKAATVTGFLEGDSRIPPLFRGEQTPIEVDAQTQGRSPMEIAAEIKKQISSVESDCMKKVNRIEISESAEVAQSEIRHRHQVVFLKHQQIMERRKLTQFMSSRPYNAFSEWQLNRMEQEHKKQGFDVRNQHNQERHELRIKFESEKQKVRGDSAAVKGNLQEMIDKLKATTQQRAVHPDRVHTTVDVMKGPCKSNGHKRNLVRVCLPADTASYMIREDKIYDMYYRYT